MGERKLNFNAPLLSVRRFSTATISSDGAKGKKAENSRLNRRNTLPIYKADTNSDQVTEPVAVPFRWEQIPGRRKGVSKLESQKQEEASVTPRIPPGRALHVVKLPKEKKFDDGNVFSPQVEAKSSDENVTELDYSKDVNEKAHIGPENVDDNDDVYSDALDTLCPADSLSANCSISCLSGFDDLALKPYGTFSTDQQTRDFMMSRFLPAAKAMTLEPPRYASRKQPVSAEQPKQIAKVVHRDRTPVVNRYESAVIPHSGQDIDQQEESDDGDDRYDISRNISAKGCGLLPRLCFKNSLGLLNPVPGIKFRAHASSSASNHVDKPSKTADSRSQSQTKKKHSKDGICKQKLKSAAQSPRLLQDEKKLSCGSNRFTYATDRQMISRTSPFRRSGSLSPLRRPSPGRNEAPQSRNDAPQSPFRGAGYRGITKEPENLKANSIILYNKCSSKSQELLSQRRSSQGSCPVSKSQELFSHHIGRKGSFPVTKSQELGSYYGTRRGSRPVSPTVEKTLYVDTVKLAEISFTNPSSSDIKVKDSALKDFQTTLRSLEMEVAAATESSFKDAKCLDVPEAEDAVEHEALGSKNDGLVPTPDISHLIGQEDISKDSGEESKAMVCTNATNGGNVHIDSDSISKDLGIVETSLTPPPLAVLLPKTPSESWLWRTLPSISSQNPLSRLYRGASFQSKWQDSNTSSNDTKWETIVKSSYSHHDHVRYSQELVPHASQQSKS